MIMQARKESHALMLLEPCQTAQTKDLVPWMLLEPCQTAQAEPELQTAEECSTYQDPESRIKKKTPPSVRRYERCEEAAGCRPNGPEGQWWCAEPAGLLPPARPAMHVGQKSPWTQKPAASDCAYAYAQWSASFVT
ncbi:hypothetical protein NDU88_009934 [Pleurodeles waltl]|uniref:Uncharacterized protein n=1 Tax=Pleurodeles waltl TaxID=8319 RepID=A0AAV7PXD3_PLEWA|nr:hypothetical protein NDU88_009934 [Pleurodeles waltl]